jgi:hypothetical protein
MNIVIVKRIRGDETCVEKKKLKKYQKEIENIYINLSISFLLVIFYFSDIFKIL